jgi:hypothetical protein
LKVLKVTTVNIEWILTLVAFVFAYFFSVTLTGYLQTKVSSTLGDDTATDAGFLSLNPLAHLDVIGFALLVLMGFGWGRFVPLDPYAIHGRNRNAKLAVLYGSEALLSLAIATSAFLLLVFFLGPAQFKLMREMFGSHSVPLRKLSMLYPESSSLILVISLFLMALVFFNTFIATLSLILNGFRYLLVLGFDNGYSYMRYADYFAFILPFFVVFFFANPLRYLLLSCIAYLAHFIGAL